MKSRPHVTLLVLTTCLTLTALLWTQLKSTPISETESASSAQLLARQSPTQENALIWAGLSGRPPRFIDSGPNRGLGWVEYQTHEIRKGLKNDGIALKVEYMTPARIDHEMRKQSPICTYPVEWKSPEKTFATKPDRIYSIPLDLSGESTQSILIRKKDAPKFEKHRDKKGDLSLLSLLKDPNLKTVLVQGKDYGPLTQLVLEPPSNRASSMNERSLKPEFEKNIALRVFRDNQQIIEMLNAGRFDYTFTDAVEFSDFESTGLDPSEFLSIAYSSVQVKSLDDPRLERISVVCSIHPLTIRAMPLINKWIKKNRGLEWLQNKIDYRSRLDRGFNDSWTNATLARFYAPVANGEADRWYPLQQKHFPGLQLFPPPLISIDKNLHDLPSAVPSGTHPLRWRIFYGKKGEALVINASDAGLFAMPEPELPATGWEESFDYSFVIPYLPLQFTESVLAPLAFQDRSQAVAWESLSIPTQLQSLTVFGPTLTPADLDKLKGPLTSLSLKRFAFFGGSTELINQIVDLLPPTLEQINFTGSSLTHSKIHEKIKGMPLQELHLNGTGLSESQINTVLKGLPQNLQKLSLGFQQTSWSHDSSRLFLERSFQNLTDLDLANNALLPDEIRIISKGIPSTLQSLKLRSNRFGPDGTRSLLSHPFPNLRVLDLSEMKLLGDLDPALSFPPSLQTLKLRRAGLRAPDTSKLKFPPHLKVLDLFSNRELGDRGLLQILASLDGKLEIVDFGETDLSTATIQWISEHLGHLNALRLQGNRVADSDLRFLTKAAFHLEELNLASNRVMNEGAKEISSGFLHSVKTLSLSNNFISEEGSRSLFKALPARLQSLSLKGLLQLDFEAMQLPPGLRQLDLSGNQISDREMLLLGPHLPQTLVTLDLSDSAFGSEGAWHLAASLPTQLRELALNKTPIQGKGLAALAQALPESLARFELGQLKVERHDAQVLAEHFPKHLLSLTLQELEIPASEVAAILAKLPDSLRGLQLKELPIQRSAAIAFAQHFPKQLTKLELESTSTGDDALQILLRDLPITLDSLSLNNVGLGEKGIVALSQNSLANLHYLETISNPNALTAKAVKALEAMMRPRLVSMTILASGLTQESIREFGPNSLSHLRQFVAVGNPIGNTGAALIASKLPPELGTLQLMSSGITPDGVAPLLSALPARLRSLYLRGNEIGEVGFAKLTREAQRRAKEGHPLILKR